MLQNIFIKFNMGVSYSMINSEEEGKIIAYRKFDSAIEANVAKTKLDAYGIPCFLTNETVSSLYSLPYMDGMEVVLHIFERDTKLAEELLASLSKYEEE
jgi:Putative prokaryotic signal transducing protein